MTTPIITPALSGKVAIVTGGARGIGRAIALRLARDGASVVISYKANVSAASQTIKEIEVLDARGLAVAADMGDLTAIRTLFEKTAEQFGRIDILVNNAGTAQFSPLAEVTPDAFDQIFAVNARGTFFAMQEAARRLENGGRIISISSGITILGGPGGSVYAGSKAAVEQFTMACAKELGSRGITVNTVSAGGTATDLLDEVVPKHIQELMAANSPFGRIGQPDDIADVVAFLASSDARWITGQNLRATGGAA